MKTLFTFLLISLSINHSSAAMTVDEAFRFRQSELSLQNILTDQVLIKRVEQARINIGLRLQGKKPYFPEGEAYEDEGPADSLSKENIIRIDGWENPYIKKNFINMFLQIMSEEKENGILPTTGEFHAWTKETKKSHRLNWIVKFDKVLVALALGVTYRVMYTGHEDELKAFLLNQEDKSVPFHEFFRVAYRISNGNIYLALLTMENILASNWNAPNRQHIPYFKKLIPLHSHYNEGRDVYGTYYHFIGIMLYGYVKGGLAAGFVGFMEGIGSKILSRFEPEVQENLANMKGGAIGALLRNAIRNDDFSHFTPDKSYLKTSHYLKHDEDFRDRLPLEEISENLSVKTLSAHHRDSMVTALIKNSGPSLYDCQIVMFTKTHKNGKSTRRVRRGDLLENKSYSFRFNSSVNFPKVRVFVDNCQDSDFQGATQSRNF